MNKKALIEQLKKDEGFVGYAYSDTRGYLTIGYGTLIDKRGGGIPEDIAGLLLDRKVDQNIVAVNKALPWLSKHPENVQLAIHNMAYQLGVAGLLKFKISLELLRQSRYNDCADNLKLSLWFKQTPERALRVINLIRGK